MICSKPIEVAYNDKPQSKPTDRNYLTAMTYEP